MFDNGFHQRVVNAIVFIFNEITGLLPMPGGVSVDRCTDHFSAPRPLQSSNRIQELDILYTKKSSLAWILQMPSQQSLPKNR
ncbi:hypothetical protein D3C78_932800 [compost metagenome]